MKDKKIEAIVGVFVIIALVLLGWMSVKFKTISLGKKPAYTIYADFNNISGIEKNAKVNVAGVNVGFVKSIGLKKGKAVVGMSIYKQYKIPVDSSILISSNGLLGEKFLDIKIGHSEAYLKDGDTLANTQSSIGVNELIRNVNSVFNERNRENLNEILNNFNKISNNLNEILDENRKAIRESIAEAEAAFNKFNRSMDNLYFLTNKIRNGEGNLGKLVNDDDFYNNIDIASKDAKQITHKINAGKGTLGKLVNDESVYDKLDETLVSINNYLEQLNRTQFNVRLKSEYQFRHNDNKEYAGVDIYTAPDRFYRIMAVNEKDYKYDSDPSGNNSDRVRLTALMGKRYYNFTLLGGAIESTFGVGLDYYPEAFNNVRLGARFFDFDHENDIRDTHPQLKAEIEYRFLRHFALFGGVNEILNSRSRSLYAGLGMEFSDSDIPYALSKAPAGAIK